MNLRVIIKDIFLLNIPSFKKRFLKYRKIILIKFMYSLYYLRIRKVKRIPVIINNFNRLTYLMQLIEWLENVGMTNIYILDNNSEYPPLLNYYETCKYKVFRLSENLGHLALWKTNICKMFNKNYYIYTDPDILPCKECPGNFIEFFMLKLNQYKNITKIGFGLRIDDLPDNYKDKQKVIQWEEKFWTAEVEPDIYDADIDTTFALYKPLTNYYLNHLKAYRTGGKYIARHLPWYENSNNPTEENIFYKANVKPGASHWISPEN